MDLGSDQTSLHDPFGGGYYPTQLSLEEARVVMKDDPLRFKELVQERYEHEHVCLIKSTHAYTLETTQNLSKCIHIHTLNRLYHQE